MFSVQDDLGLMMSKFGYLSYGLIVCLLVSSCDLSAPNIHPPTTPAPPITIPFSPTGTEPFVFPTSTMTLTPQPLSTATPYYTQTTLPTFFPALPSQEAKLAILELYKNNGMCRLPCWWGINPGVTTLDEANRILSPLGDTLVETNEQGVAYQSTLRVFSSIDPGEQIEARLVAKANLVTGIYVSSSSVMRSFDHTFAGILNYFGPAEEIWIDFHGRQGSGSEKYDLILFYPVKGVLVRIFGNASEKEGIYSVCPQIQPTEAPTLYLWSPDKKISLSTIGSDVFLNLVNSINKSSLQGFVYLKSLIVDFNPSTFYRTFRKPNNDSCIAINMN